MTPIASFLRNQRGSLSVEAVLVFPLLLWAFAATFVFWDVYQSENDSQRAAFTIADTLSRETGYVDADYIAGLNRMHSFLTKSNHPVQLRVSTLKWNASSKEFEIIWSHSPNNNLLAHDDETINMAAAEIPDMAVGDIAILVETQMEWEPIFRIGLEPRKISQFVITRPRFGPQLVWERSDGTRIGDGEDDSGEGA